MTIDEYAATIPLTTNGADRVQFGLDYVFTNYDDLLRRLADGPESNDAPPEDRP
jgi:hypothetical protein